MKKRITSLLLALLMLLSLVPAAAAEESAVTVEVPGVLQYTKASSVTNLVNAEREEAGLEPMIRCYNLTLLARQRAAEIALYCDHIRPDGSDWSTVWTDNGSDCTALAENIVMGCGEAAAAVNLWMAAEESAANILNPEYTEFGVACLEVNGIYCWVQIFGTGSDQGDKSYSKTGTEDVDTTVSVLTSNLVPVEAEHYVEVPNGYAVQMGVASYENLPAGEGWHLNLVPECPEIVAEDGTVIAKSNVVPDGTGLINFKTRREGIGTGAFPVYEGQPDPITLTVNCGAFEKPVIPEREAPTVSASPYAHVHTPELMNVVEGTCSSEGYTGDLTCTVCLEVLEEGGSYMKEHTWGHWVVTAYPDGPANGGGKECTCTVCGYTINTGATATEDPHPDGNAITMSANMDCTLYQSITAAVEGHDIFIDVIHGDHFFLKNVTITTDTEGETIPWNYNPTHSSQGILWFTMPDSPVHVYIELEEEPKYSIYLDVGEGGTATVSKEQGYEGTGFYLDVNPDEGYMISSINLLSYGTYVPFYRQDADNSWYVEIPDGDLEVIVRFLPAENPFVDVTEEDFYFMPVLWAYHNGITTGTDDTHFSPAKECNRAQIVTFLWRAAGCPEPETSENPFVDVQSTDFFYKAVLWAVENGITNGTDDTHFSPNQVCNRAQAVTFLWRACGEPEHFDGGNFFEDVDTTAFYYDAMLWAVDYGITNGLDNYHFGPNVSCNRAQIVTFLYRTFAV